MLASSGPVRDERRFGFEPKLDGWRAVVHVTRGDVAVYTRTGREVSAVLPELSALVEAVPDGTVLDGELVAGDGRATSFYRLRSLLASRPERRCSMVTFAAFDLLSVEGDAVIARSYEERRRLLENLGFQGAHWCTIPSWKSVAADDLLAVCQRHDVEGLVAKRLSSRYWPGKRRSDWVKVKTAEWRAVHSDLRHDRRPA